MNSIASLFNVLAKTVESKPIDDVYNMNDPEDSEMRKKRIEKTLQDVEKAIQRAIVNQETTFYVSVCRLCLLDRMNLLVQLVDAADGQFLIQAAKEEYYPLCDPHFQFTRIAKEK